MRTLIIEDEQATAQRLKKLLQEIEPEIEVLAILDSIESCVKWFKPMIHQILYFRILNWLMVPVLKFSNR